MNFKALKMDGLGNDFLIIDNRDQKVSLNQEQILKLSDKKTSFNLILSSSLFLANTA